MKEIAIHFKEQCVGTHNGEMAPINNHPVIASIFNACGYKTYSDNFQEILRKLADVLDTVDKEKQDIPF